MRIYFPLLIEGQKVGSLHGPMAFNPSSIVNTAPHFGHFTFVSFGTPAQPKVNAKTATARTMLTSFFTPLHLLSPYEIFSFIPNGFPPQAPLLGRRGWKNQTFPIFRA
jgi:hypothetical protein